jgi:hypothetical protein
VRYSARDLNFLQSHFPGIFWKPCRSGSPCLTFPLRSPESRWLPTIAGMEKPRRATRRRLRCKCRARAWRGRSHPAGRGGSVHILDARFISLRIVAGPTGRWPGMRYLGAEKVTATKSRQSGQVREKQITYLLQIWWLSPFRSPGYGTVPGRPFDVRPVGHARKPGPVQLRAVTQSLQPPLCHSPSMGLRQYLPI